jgi:hypothetical protein
MQSCRNAGRIAGAKQALTLQAARLKAVTSNVENRRPGRANVMNK